MRNVFNKLTLSSLGTPKLRLALLAGLLLAARCGSDGSGDGSGNLSKGTNAILVVDPKFVNFASVDLNQEAKRTVRLICDKSSTRSIKFTSVRLDAVESALKDLKITQPVKGELKPGEETSLEVIYKPTDGVYDTGKIKIEFDGGATEVPITTLAQAGNLLVSPEPIQFGAVQSGTTKTLAVSVTNVGSDEITVGNTALSLGYSPDFELVLAYALGADGKCVQGQGAPVTYPLKLGLNQGYCVDITYVPHGGTSDEGLLRIMKPQLPGQPKPEEITTTKVFGSETGPKVVIRPELKLDFAAVPMNQSKTLTFKIANEGTQDLTIDSVEKSAALGDAFEAVTIVTAVPKGTLVKAEATAELPVEVKFAPGKTYPAVNGPLGFIDVKTNDATSPITKVTVYGVVASGKLQIAPGDVIDFGVVATSKTSTRTLTFTTTGSADVTVSGIAVSKNSAQNEFKPSNGTPASVLVAPGTSQAVTLEFTNQGGAEGETVTGTLAFTSTDPQGPTSIDLRAIRTAKASCEIELIPPTINFGVVPYGKERTLAMNLHNKGSAPCSFQGVVLADGASNPFAAILPGAGPQCTVPSSNKSKYFGIVESPLAIQDGIAPGDTVSMKVRFVPEPDPFSAAFSFDQLATFSASLQVLVYDYSTLKPGTTQPTQLLSPQGKPGDAIACNILGKSGPAQIAAIPGQIDFGLTTVGCHSKTHTVSIYNTGVAPLSVCDIKLVGCGPEMKLKNVPPIPGCTGGVGGIELKPNSPIKLSTVYAPQDTSSDSCAIEVYTDDPLAPAVSVPLNGAGTYDTEQTDTFKQGSGQEVDVLIVVDNSGSMGEEQNNLANNFSSFVQDANATWKTDYHIAVTTTDMEDAKHSGKFQGSPRFVTNKDVSAIGPSLKVGANGSGNEQGLAAAQAALSAPLTTELKPPKECNSANDCTKPLDCMASVITPGKKYCGGHNMEFLRKDATLEIVIVSDEEDGSPAQLNFYVDFLKAIKGYANTNLLHVHAIVGDKNNGCQGAGGEAAPGNRYIEVASQTAGKVVSICTTDWAKALKDIGTVAFGLKVQFFLSRPPVVETITVTVAGKQCLTGWKYEEVSNTVIFDDKGSCMPQEGQTIDIHYKVFCYSE